MDILFSDFVDELLEGGTQEATPICPGREGQAKDKQEQNSKEQQGVESNTSKESAKPPSSGDGQVLDGKAPEMADKSQVQES
mmetsp:Transcript_12841/g.18950  ORF Transcript_12841/g.18950 Transcript_12841/m.18950 type:complete len:82 (-) Transcript_12841:319-564(-)